MSTKNTKKNKTPFSAASSSLHSTATRSEGKYKEMVSINPGLTMMISSLYSTATRSEGKYKERVSINPGFRMLILLAIKSRGS